MNKLKARIDAFNRLIVDAKAANVWDSIEAACIMAGWSNVAGALTPLKGAAPTNNGFTDSDLDAGIGLVGDGSSKYLNSNRANNADGQTDKHLAAYSTEADETNAGIMGAFVRVPTLSATQLWADAGVVYAGINTSTGFLSGPWSGTGFVGGSHSGATLSARWGNASYSGASTVDTHFSQNSLVFARYDVSTVTSRYSGRLAFYSIGSSVDLAALDAVVSQLAADLRAIDEDGFDPLATDYIRRVEAADGAYLETGVKQAINAFVVGCRKDGTLDALKASCIMCGARTISGALVPLVGPAPTAEGAWASGDYDRATGMKGNGSSLYLDSNRASNADPIEDHHLACYATATSAAATHTKMGAADAAAGSYDLVRGADRAYFYSRGPSYFTGTGLGNNIGFYGYSRSGATLNSRTPGVSYSATRSAVASNPYNIFVFGYNNSGSLLEASSGRLAFYSIGSAISDLSLLDNRVSTLISSIAATLS